MDRIVLSSSLSSSYEVVRKITQEGAQLVVPISVFVAVLGLCLVIGHLLKESRWVNESITAILIGFISGTFILVLSKGKSSHILVFNEELFFIYILPPIIFNAGFQVKKKQFFQNFITIMLFGAVGVFISTFVITAEKFMFLYVGMDALDIEKCKMTKLSLGTSMCTSSALVFLILLGRAAFVFPLSAFSNLMNRGRTSPITFKHQTIIWWAGLMKGAVSVALAYKQFTYYGVTRDPVNATMVTNTIIVVLFTTSIFGFLTKPLVHYLIPHHANDDNNQREPKSPQEDVTLPLLTFKESASTNIDRANDSLPMLVERPVYTIHHYWRKFDNVYMRPIFGGPLTSHSES